MRMSRTLTVSGFKVTPCALDNIIPSFMAYNTDISTYLHNDVTLVFKIHIKFHNLPVTESQNSYKLDSISWQRWLKMFSNGAESPAMQEEVWDSLG